MSNPYKVRLTDVEIGTRRLLAAFVEHFDKMDDNLVATYFAAADAEAVTRVAKRLTELATYKGPCVFDVVPPKAAEATEQLADSIRRTSERDLT